MSRASGATRAVFWLVLLAALAGCGHPDRGDDARPPGDGGARSGPVDPDCIDGMYTEVLPDPSVSLDDVFAGYTGDYQAFVNETLSRRYPLGAEIVRRGRMSSSGDCVAPFITMPEYAEFIIPQLSTFVHECGHFVDIDSSSASRNSYLIREDLILGCEMGDSVPRGGRTFARSRIQADDQSSMWPPCAGAPGRCDSYAAVYLDGDPDDTAFQSGDQGFAMLLEEATQYVNSLATAYAVHDRLGALRTTERDGVLTFLWYIERYLTMARTEHPDAYSLLVDEECWRTAILTVWGRAWFYLEATDEMDQLGIFDGPLMDLVTTPELLGEIARLGDAAGCGPR